MPLKIAERAHKRGKHRADQGAAGGGISPERGCVHVAHAVLMGDFLEENRQNDGRYDRCKR